MFMPYSSTQWAVNKLDLSPFRHQVMHEHCVNIAWGAGMLKSKVYKNNHHTLEDVW
jgi:hypothetical protein